MRRFEVWFGRTGIFGRKVDLLSPFPLADCVQRLKDAMDDPVGTFGGQPVVGRLDGVRLRVRKRIGYQNSHQAYLLAELSDQGGMTLFRCSFSMHWFAMGATIAGFAWMLGNLANAMAIQNPVFGPASMLALCSAGMGFVCLIAYEERRFLIRFLRHVVEAREV